MKTTIELLFKTLGNVLLVLALATMMASCASQKKKKCDTCPKWTSDAVQHSERALTG